MSTSNSKAVTSESLGCSCVHIVMVLPSTGSIAIHRSAMGNIIVIQISPPNYIPGGNMASALETG